MDTRGLALSASLRLGIAHDDAGITEAARCVYDAGVVVPESFPADPWVNLADVRAGRFAVASFRGTAAEIEDAWERVFSAWLPDSGFAPDDQPAAEIYRGAPSGKSPRGVFRCELALPVRTL